MATANVELPDRHEHPLTWVAEAEPFKCRGCNEDGYHVRYACRSRSCRHGRPFHLHAACAQQFGSSLPHPLKRGNLLFRNSPSQPEHPCRACGGKVTGYAYDYERKRRLFGCILERATVLHPCCAALPTSIEQAGLLIPVKLELKRRLKSPCCKCGHVRFEGKRRTWGYVSADKVMQIHVACANRMFREAYEAARQRKPSMVSRLIARLTRTLSGSTVNGGGGPSTERPGTGGAGSGSAGAAGALPVPELPIVNVPKEKSRKECVMRAVWSTIGTVGAVITGTGDPIAMISLLMDILSSTSDAYI